MISFAGQPTGVFTVPVGTAGLNADTTTPTEDVVVAVQMICRVVVAAPQVQPYVNVLVSRPSVHLTIDTPVISHGKPVLPKYLGLGAHTGTVIRGVGHMRAFPDPDPVWGGSNWTVAPPTVPSGANFVRWTARSLPDPSGDPGSEYPLGTADAFDGTAGYAVHRTRWESAAGSDFSIPWQSAYPFKPSVGTHIHYGPDGSKVTELISVRFTPAQVQHMWADFGTMLTPPFTIVTVAIVTDFRRTAYYNYLLDSGQSPLGAVTVAQRQAWYTKHSVPADIALSENLGYRTGLQLSRHEQKTFNDMHPTTRMGKIPFRHTYKPKMFTMIVNGSSSMQAVHSTSEERYQNIRLTNHGAQRLAVMGRANGRLSPDSATSMVVFEIRAWDKALTRAQLAAQYEQLSTTWRFHQYK